MRRLLSALLLLACFAPLRAGDEDEQLLTRAKLREDTDLLDFLHKRADPRPVGDFVSRQVRRLADPNSEAADCARREVLKVGKPALTYLRSALQDSDLARGHARMRDCLEILESHDSELSPAVIRRLALSRPAGLVPALLDFLAVADESLSEEIRTVLLRLHGPLENIDPAIDAGLKSRSDTVRLLAVEVLLRRGSPAQVTVARKVLASASVDVRLKLGLLLEEIRDPEAITTLLGVLRTGNLEQARLADEALHRIAGPLSPGDARFASDETSRKRCQEAWENWVKALDPARALAWVRKQIPTFSPEQIPELVKKLGARSFKVREQATLELIKLRALAIPELEKALTDPDQEVRRRAERCLLEIRDAPRSPETSAFVRLLGYLRPAGAAELLIEYIPAADDDQVAEEARQSLLALARHNVAVQKALARVLENGAMRRRQVAVAVLGEVAPAQYQQALRKALRDSHVPVRHAAALALLRTHDRQAVPTLIALLEESREELAVDIDELLRSLADPQSKPPEPVGRDADSRKTARKAWEEWWKKNGAQVNLARLSQSERTYNYIVASLWPYGDGTISELVEMSRDGKVRWKIEKIHYGFDFEILPGNRLLVAENTGGRVTERNFKGDVLWEYKIGGPYNVQRLPNGNTFIVGSNQVVEVDRTGRALWTVNVGSMTGGRFKDGGFVVSTGSQLIFYGSNQKELRRVNHPGLSNVASLAVSPKQTVLICFYHMNKIIEYDREGKVVREIPTPSPNMVTVLKNGHMLVGSQDQKQIVELDRNGKEVWKYNGAPTNRGCWKIQRR